MNPNSKDSRDRNPKKVSTSGDAEAPNPKASTSSTIFVVNREMFPSKYEDFSAELLEQILQELNFQRLAVRRALVPAGGSAPTAIDTDIGERHRNSTQVGSPHNHKLNSKNKPALALPSSESFAGSTSTTESTGSLPSIESSGSSSGFSSGFSSVTPHTIVASSIVPEPVVGRNSSHNSVLSAED
jgi:hypothetical protein